MGKKIKSFSTTVLIALGGGLVYVTAGDLLGVNADTSSTASVGVSTQTIALLMVTGVALVAIGLMMAVYIFSPTIGKK